MIHFFFISLKKGSHFFLKLCQYVHFKCNQSNWLNQGECWKSAFSLVKLWFIFFFHKFKKRVMIFFFWNYFSTFSAVLAVPGQPNNKFLISRHSPLIFANIIPDFLAMIVTKIMLRLHWIFQRFLAGIVATIVTKITAILVKIW